MLDSQNSVLLVIDVQGTLAQMMHNKESFFKHLRIMIQGARILEIPIIWLEQIPEKLGATTPDIAALMPGLKPVPKHTFSAWGEPVFRKAFETVGRRQVLFTGIETHICVCQTASDTVAQGCGVHVVADAVASRNPFNKDIGLEKIRNAGGLLTSAETVLFEIMKEAKGEKFKQIVSLVK